MMYRYLLLPVFYFLLPRYFLMLSVNLWFRAWRRTPKKKLLPPSISKPTIHYARWFRIRIRLSWESGSKIQNADPGLVVLNSGKEKEEMNKIRVSKSQKIFLEAPQFAWSLDVHHRIPGYTSSLHVLDKNDNKVISHINFKSIALKSIKSNLRSKSEFT